MSSTRKHSHNRRATANLLRPDTSYLKIMSVFSLPVGNPTAGFSKLTQIHWTITKRTKPSDFLKQIATKKIVS